LLFLFLAAVGAAARAADEDSRSYDNYYFGRDYSQGFSTKNYFTDFTAAPESFSSAQAYSWPVAPSADVSQAALPSALFTQPRELPSQMPDISPIANLPLAIPAAETPQAENTYFPQASTASAPLPLTAIPVSGPAVEAAAPGLPADTGKFTALPVWQLPQDSGIGDMQTAPSYADSGIIPATGNFSEGIDFNQGG
jgi:hypothetical protein